MAAATQKDISTRVERGECAVCFVAGARACSVCYVDFYCNREHQKQDWLRHKAGCGAIEVPGNGDCPVALRDIPAGTRILREMPSVIFPKLPNDSESPQCRGCCALLRAGPASVCKDCGLPRCRQDCDVGGQHRAECTFIAGLRRTGKMKTPIPSFGLHASYAFNTLRVYLWLHENPKQEEFLRRNMDSDAAMNEVIAAGWQYCRDWLLKELGMFWVVDHKLQRAYRLAVRSSMLCHSPKPSNASVHFGDALTRQSCLPNVFDVVVDTETLEHVLVTARPVRRGERLSVDHLEDPLMDVSKRRWYMKMTDRQCWCALCSDPTYQGVHLLSWACSHCPGLVVPLRAQWAEGESPGGRCDQCGRATPAAAFQQAGAAPVQGLELLVASGLGAEAAAPWEQYLRAHLRPRGPLHSSHVLALRAKGLLAEAIVKADPGPCLASDKYTIDVLHRWKTSIESVLSALDVLRPGFSCPRNKLLLPLMKVLMCLAASLEEERSSEANVYLDKVQKLVLESSVVCFNKQGRDCLDAVRFQLSLLRQVVAAFSVE